MLEIKLLKREKALKNEKRQERCRRPRYVKISTSHLTT